MAVGERKIGQIVQDLILFTAAPLLAFFLARQILNRIDPDAGAKAEAQKKANAASTRLDAILSNHEKRDDFDEDDEDGEDGEDNDDVRAARIRGARDRKELVLSTYEQTIAMEVVSPDEIPVTFEDIGGLTEIIEELRESVIYPLTMPQLYSRHSSLLTAPSGVLLYGPPGCGKTMLAKALARESGACFINLHISTLTEKWYGDSNKLVAAVFSLARKLQPTIVFIDEIDAVLGQRRSSEHEASGMVKAEFMTHWDGLSSSTVGGGQQRICILGATNRMHDIDEAILRRMPKKFPISLPNSAQRRQIFSLTLRDTKIDSSISDNGSPLFDMDALVRVSVGMSGSDIKEACRDAAMMPVREYIKSAQSQGINMRRRMAGNAVRGLQTRDFFGHGGGIEQLQLNVAGGPKHTKGQQAEGDHASQDSDATEEVDEFSDPEEQAP